MRGIICTLLFTLIIFLNYAELWAMDGSRKHFALPPPRPNRFATYPPGATFWKNGKIVGFMDTTLRNFVIDRQGFPFEPLLQTKAYLPQAALVYRDAKLIGVLKNEEIIGKYINGWHVIFSPKNGDEVKNHRDRILAKYHDGWEAVPHQPAGN